MINFTEIDLKNKNNRIIIFILSLFLLFLNHFETKTLVSILVMIILINQYSSLKENIGTKLINNKEMILHVYEAAMKANAGEVYVATPDKKIIAQTEDFGNTRS